ncbi:phenylalanine--tRNA [Ecytonucleospora hepatopenaei]|uniref:phenylalanine--tRNA ligase n=1 Tax=Ecytonucleospora hepatopenaei TaxID=646526 RepID=A0A1W0E500_9MICR|nr:phenylalanine--tRNA [Ecytonucleospora hepatopenaei]
MMDKNKTTPLKDIILTALDSKDIVYSYELKCNLNDLHSLLLSLSSKEIVEFEIEQNTQLFLTEKGIDVLKNGTPEYTFIKKILNMEIKDIKEIENKEAVANIYKNNWLNKKNDEIEDNVKILIENNLVKNNLNDNEEYMVKNDIQIQDLKMLKKRKFIEVKKANIYKITKGKLFGKESIAFVTELTADNLFEVDEKKLKPYNFDVESNQVQCGSIHPLMKIKDEYKKIFLEMGFTEMDTNKYVESSFWNFDALFQPQNHPSRESQDTFFVGLPSNNSLEEVDAKYLKRVSDIHSSTYDNIKEEFKCFSIGHKNLWKIEEATKNILRTHTTAISARLLYKIAEKIRKTGHYDYKFFSIDKVFRNETVDATHLAEFHQVEGIVVGKELTLKELISVLQSFFKKLGIEKLRFKPAFNPYTEPSMEIFGFHEGLGKWVELGNSGIFRPEMLLPMGFPSDVTIIAWGLSLERPAMIRYGLNNIRDLVGHKVDLNFIRESPVVFFNK